MKIRSICVRLCLAFAAVFVYSTACAQDKSRSASPRATANLSAGARPSVGSWFATTYEQLGEDIFWSTCGYNATSSGCYGSGTIGPFVRPCSIAGSADRVFVLDSGGQGDHAMLYVYKQISSSTPSMTLLKEVELSALDRSGTAHCSLAVLGSWLYAAHDESTDYSRVHLTDYSEEVDGNCGVPTTSITASRNAVVVSSESNCMREYDSQGNVVQAGGAGTDIFVLNSNGYVLP
ncbi:MAG TPA: hypothetical protein VFI26_04935 [Lysobacter sp.]|jgi:hypothetical protein|nr:hypothetical protein [Lysobacter sp.]